MTFSYTTKKLPQKSGEVFTKQYSVKASAIYTRGVGVYLPWSLKSHNAMIRSSIELNIPVGVTEKRSLGTEGPIHSYKTHFNIGFEKKFPALRLSKTPMTSTFHFDPVNHSPVTNFVPIKKSDIQEKVIRIHVRKEDDRGGVGVGSALLRSSITTLACGQTQARDIHHGSQEQ
ncbi:GATA zinc finger domain-containing protein 1 [Armadillidium nasatum]|uniref:GATA zinc finger domain-containing protein 1 n=1 Tax=Armadillidium nasatum TaxID=96803 RepID=A0A5N5T398_9CRUS|nr:GATA zinc finger domain-containing protein 1 [Armadillidium nasatum]